MLRFCVNGSNSVNNGVGSNNPEIKGIISLLIKNGSAVLGHWDKDWPILPTVATSRTISQHILKIEKDVSKQYNFF